MVTSTGDLSGNIERLKLELGKIKFPAKKFSENLIREGEPAGFLPILHYTLLNFSKPLARKVVQEGYELNGKTDLRFLEAVWKLLRIMLRYRPSLTVNQFLSQGFAERKVLMTCDFIAMCKHEHNELLRAAGRPIITTKRRPRSSMGASSGHIWGSPVKKSVGDVVQSSPPPSAARRRKKLMQQTPPHLQAPRGQVEVVDGGDIPVHVVRSSVATKDVSVSDQYTAGELRWDGAVPGHPFVYYDNALGATGLAAAPPTEEQLGVEAGRQDGDVEEEIMEEEEQPHATMPLFEGTFSGWAQVAGVGCSHQQQAAPLAAEPPSIPTTSESKAVNVTDSSDADGIVVVVNKEGKCSPKRRMKKRSPRRNQASEHRLVEAESPHARAGEIEEHAEEHQALRALIEDLSSRLLATEEQISEMAVASLKTEQTLQARITILEGRVRFLEGAVEERGAYVEQPRQLGHAVREASSGQESVPPSTALGRALEMAGPYTVSQVKTTAASKVMAECTCEAKAPHTAAAEEERMVTTAHTRSTLLHPVPEGNNMVSTNEADASLNSLKHSEVSGSDSQLRMSNETADFISSIAGRFEAARALLDSM